MRREYKSRDGRQFGILAEAVLGRAGKAAAIEKIKAKVHTGRPALRKI